MVKKSKCGLAWPMLLSTTLCVTGHSDQNDHRLWKCFDLRHKGKISHNSSTTGWTCKLKVKCDHRSKFSNWSHFTFIYNPVQIWIISYICHNIRIIRLLLNQDLEKDRKKERTLEINLLLQNIDSPEFFFTCERNIEYKRALTFLPSLTLLK